MDKNRLNSNAIEKALCILMAFYPQNSEMGTVELSRKMGFHPATVNRILQILARNRFLFQNPLSRKFNLGPSVFALGEAAIESLNDNLLHKALPYLDELCEKVRETVVLEVISGENGIVVYVAQGKQTIGIRANIGSRLPIHAAAGAKAIIAFSSPETVDAFLKKRMRHFTKKTITNPQKLKLELEKIRKEGVAFTREEIDVGVNAIGAPILNYKNQPLGAVVIVGPCSRIKCNKRSPLVSVLKETVSAISAYTRQPGGKGEKK